ncbi:MAG: glutamine amidotransferase, partial [Rhodoplanes sp.]
MPDCVAIRHVAFEDLGLLPPQLGERGFAVRYREAGLDVIAPTSLIAPDLVVILGGPIGVYEEDLYPFLRDELAAIRARLEAGRPTLGICL